MYILGDLFEVWIGDDDETPPYPEILSLLRRFSDSGTPLFVMRGNRDFLFGQAFEKKTGAQLLPDPVHVDLAGCKALLMHGDLLCTRDLDYQRFRSKVRNPEWQRRFLARPRWLRKWLGRLARYRSRMVSRRKPEDLMDVDAETVVAFMRTEQARLLIHGHTHRPAIHELTLDGKAVRRIVLGDWYEQDSVLSCDSRGPRLIRVAEFLDELRQPGIAG